MIVNILIDRFICNYYNLIKENASQREGRRGRGRPARWFWKEYKSKEYNN
jgi:hypothetical protein